MDSVKDVEDFNFEFCVSMTLIPLVVEDLRKNFLPNIVVPCMGLFCQWISSQLMLAPISYWFVKVDAIGPKNFDSPVF